MKMKYIVYLSVCLSLVIGSAVYFKATPSNSNKADFSSLANQSLEAEFGKEAEANAEAEEEADFSVIKDPDVLEVLEKTGFSLSGLLNSIATGERSDSSVPSSNLENYQKSPLYQSVMKVLTNDIKEIIADENRASPGSAGVGMAFSKRGFDARWFSAQRATFELIGIVNRTDQLSMHTDTCGELRFIYRLSINVVKPTRFYTRMPMTLMLKFTQPKEESYKSCFKFAYNWINPKEKLSNEEYAKWLVSDSGPLSPTLFQPSTFKSAEVNLQAFRIPATIQRKMGGHASYLLRVFKKQSDELVPDYLVNTIDVQKILADAKNPNGQKLKGRLYEFLTDRSEIGESESGKTTKTDQFSRLDRGVILIPEEFLATKAISYSPYGISRYSNRIYDQVFSEKDFEKMDYSGNHYVKSAGAVLRRLNDLSCVGCHQARATAGFHFLGIDKKTTHPMNALNFEGSGHFQIELERRADFLKEYRRNQSGAPARDFSFAPPRKKKAGYGHFCGLPNTNDFKRWQCEDGLICQKSDEASNDNVLGKCLPAVLKAGDPCMFGSVKQADRNSDEIVLKPTSQCNAGKGGYSCQPVVGPPGTKLGGFPTGMCQASSCSHLDAKSEVCGKIAGKGFSLCLGDKSKTPDYCLDNFSQSVGLGLCDSSRACRNDYVCVRVNKTQGACMPSYFVFQVRQDGHPEPQ